MMEVAKTMAQQSTCSSKHKVGAVLTIDNHIIATGYNGAPKGIPHCDDIGCELDLTGRCVRAIHAEINAVIQCAVYGISSRGAIMYVTLAPCRACANAIIQAGIKEIRYADTSSASAVAFLNYVGIQHCLQPSVTP
jgi:dCMP deaminase